MRLLGYAHLFDSQGTMESQIIPLKDKTVFCDVTEWGILHNHIF